MRIMSEQRRVLEPETRIVYCQLAGLLSYSALSERHDGSKSQAVPVAVAHARTICDVSEQAAATGVQAGQSVTRARRLCPPLYVVPLEEVEYRPRFRAFLDLLADTTPVVEPVEPQGAFLDLTPVEGGGFPDELKTRIARAFPFASVTVGQGRSKRAARACAECGLPPEEIANAAVEWLWQEDSTVPARLHRLGLTTFGAVAALPESALVYQFGKQGRELYRRAHGREFDPVKPLYPLPRVVIEKSFPLTPIEHQGRFQAVLQKMGEATSRRLKEQGQYSRRIRLWVLTENEECQKEITLPSPIQSTGDIVGAVQRLAQEMRFSAAVVSLRLLLEELDIPKAITVSLFEQREAKNRTRLASVERYLHHRFGRKSLLRLGEIPLSARERRRQERRGLLQ